MTAQPPIEDELFVTRNGAVTTLWLNQPAKRNAMNLDMWLALDHACRSLGPDIRLLVVRGVGGHFCAGADLSNLADRAQIDYAAANRRAASALAEVPIPTIAFITGSCVGGGVQIAAACDLRVCDGTARFGVTPARLGILYPPPALERLVTLVGPSSAKYLLYSADLIDAGQALRIGLVDQILQDDGEEALQKFVDRLGERSLFTQMASKEMIDALATSDRIPESLVDAWTTRAAASPDADEGIAAFRHGRAPAFTWSPRER